MSLEVNFGPLHYVCYNALQCTMCTLFHTISAGQSDSSEFETVVDTELPHWSKWIALYLILSDNRSLCIRYRAFFNIELPTKQSTHSTM